MKLVWCVTLWLLFSQSRKATLSQGHNKTPSTRFRSCSIIHEIALCLVAHQCALPRIKSVAGRPTMLLALCDGVRQVAPGALRSPRGCGVCVYYAEIHCLDNCRRPRVPLDLHHRVSISLLFIYIPLYILHLSLHQQSSQRWRAHAAAGAPLALPSDWCIHRNGN